MEKGREGERYGGRDREIGRLAEREGVKEVRREGVLMETGDMEREKMEENEQKGEGGGDKEGRWIGIG